MKHLRSRRLTASWIALLLAAQACADESAPTEPDPEPLQVTGVWVETVQVTLDDCGLLPETLTETRTLEQDGTELVANVDGVIIEGTIDPMTGAFTLELRAGDAFAVQTGTFTSDTRYTAETTATLANGCRFETTEEGTRESTRTLRSASRFSGV